jgi:Putative binding domain, N-terminal
MLKPVFSKMAVLALLSPAIASAQQGAPKCHATLQEGHRAVPWAGNTGDIQWLADQADCPVTSGGVNWVTVSVLPPVSGSVQRVVRFSVDTNFSPAKREGKIQIGDAAVTIEQEAGPAPGMSFSPGRLEFTIVPGKEGGLVVTKPLYVGSEEPLPFTATPDKTASWIRVATNGSDASARRTFEVTVSAVGKETGVYQGDIVIQAPGAANPQEIVPVTMTVQKGQ